MVLQGEGKQNIGGSGMETGDVPVSTLQGYGMPGGRGAAEKSAATA